MSRFCFSAATAAIVLFLCDSVFASSIFLSAERFGYTGTWTRYNSLSDAQNGVNSVEVGSMPQRDLSIYISQGADNPFDPEFDILTRWYGPDSGNPNDTNEGFFQYYDADASTVQSLDAYWNSGLTEYTLQAHAAGAVYATDFTRFGERAGGPGSATEAEFHELFVNLTISGLNGSYDSLAAGFDGSDGSGATISGSITGIVENVGTDSARNGYYVFELDLNNDSWAYEEGHVAAGEISAFSTSAVPEPSSLALLGMGTLSLLGVGWRKRRKTPLAS